MSLFSTNNRSPLGANRRLSHAHTHLHAPNPLMQWPSPETLRHANSISQSGRRRALDLYDTKDVLFSHEQMKKQAHKSSISSKAESVHG